jgi:hypothetical protein
MSRFSQFVIRCLGKSFAESTVIAVAVALAASGCSSQPSSGTESHASPSHPAITSPVPAATLIPAPAPVNPATTPAGISGDYQLYKHSTDCSGNLVCYTEVMDVRIACNGNSCTIIRTNGGPAGLQPWATALPISYDGQEWHSHGLEQNASACKGRPVAITVDLKLNVVATQFVASVNAWKVQQLMGAYVGSGSGQGDACVNYKPFSGTFILSTKKLSSWPSATALTVIEKFSGMVWQVVDMGNTVCQIFGCKFVPPNISEVISTASKAQTIGDLASATAMAVIVGQDLSALRAATAGHVKGTPLSPKLKALLKKTWNDNRKLQQALEDTVPGLSAIWPVPPPK